MPKTPKPINQLNVYPEEDRIEYHCGGLRAIITDGALRVYESFRLEPNSPVIVRQVSHETVPASQLHLSDHRLLADECQKLLDDVLQGYRRDVLALSHDGVSVADAAKFVRFIDIEFGRYTNTTLDITPSGLGLFANYTTLNSNNYESLKAHTAVLGALKFIKSFTPAEGRSFGPHQRITLDELSARERVRAQGLFEYFVPIGRGAIVDEVSELKTTAGLQDRMRALIESNREYGTWPELRNLLEARGATLPTGKRRY